jgi:hypothetical protein
MADPGLGEFVGALPDLCSGHGISDERSASIRQFADEVRKVSFDPPDGFDRIAFWPLGLRPGVWPFDGRIDRLLVVSPFLTQGASPDSSGTGFVHHWSHGRTASIWSAATRWRGTSRPWS